MERQGNQSLNKYTLLSYTSIKECIFILVMYRCGSARKYTRALTRLGLDETKGKLEEIFGCPVRLKGGQEAVAALEPLQANIYETDALEGEIESLHGGLDVLEGEAESLHGGLEALEGEVESLHGGLEALEGEEEIEVCFVEA